MFKVLGENKTNNLLKYIWKKLLVGRQYYENDEGSISSGWEVFTLESS